MKTISRITMDDCQVLITAINELRDLSPGQRMNYRAGLDKVQEALIKGQEVKIVVEPLILSGNKMIADALKQMISYTENSVEAYKAGAGEYETLSARSVLYTLGFSSNDALEILTYISENGFEYCLDYEIAHNARQQDDSVRREYPDQNACYWGADQLHSRLRCVKQPH